MVGFKHEVNVIIIRKPYGGYAFIYDDFHVAETIRRIERLRDNLEFPDFNHDYATNLILRIRLEALKRLENDEFLPQPIRANLEESLELSEKYLEELV